MSSEPAGGRPLNAKERLIVRALRQSGRPVSAYELIEQLRDDGITAPPTVYRALNRLIEEGLAHKLESKNAFVACAHPCHEGMAIFALCDRCGSVTEFDDHTVVRRLKGWARKSEFALRQMTLELRGECAQCAAQG